MAGTVYKSRAEVPTIDVALVTIEVDSREFGFDTASEVEVEPQFNETDAVQLIIKGKLKAQKRGSSILTGNQITMTDNVFNPELVQVLQGGTIQYWTSAQKTDTQNTPTEFGIAGYTPPTSASGDTGKTFKCNLYTAQYNAAGMIVNYEKCSYPNCTGVPVAFNVTDDEFRAPEYTINSAPDEDEPPYVITYVDDLPTLQDPTA